MGRLGRQTAEQHAPSLSTIERLIYRLLHKSFTHSSPSFALDSAAVADRLNNPAHCQEAVIYELMIWAVLFDKWELAEMFLRMSSKFE